MNEPRSPQRVVEAIYFAFADLAAKICVVAVTVPLLTALLMVNRQEVFRRSGLHRPSS